MEKSCAVFSKPHGTSSCCIFVLLFLVLSICSHDYSFSDYKVMKYAALTLVFSCFCVTCISGPQIGITFLSSCLSVSHTFGHMWHDTCGMSFPWKICFASVIGTYLVIPHLSIDSSLSSADTCVYLLRYSKYTDSLWTPIQLTNLFHYKE